MGFRFRKSIKAGPFRVNLSKSGIGYSVGTKGLRFTKKAGGGTRTTASIPGTGISYVKDSSGGKKNSNNQSQKSVQAASPSAVTSNDSTMPEKPIYPVTVTELLLAWFLGWIGAHKFYRKRYGIGLLYALSLGAVSIGWIGDATCLSIRYIAQLTGKNVDTPQKAVSYVIPVLFGFVLPDLPILAPVWITILASLIYIGTTYYSCSRSEHVDGKSSGRSLEFAPYTIVALLFLMLSILGIFSGKDTPPVAETVSTVPETMAIVTETTVPTIEETIVETTVAVTEPTETAIETTQPVIETSQPVIETTESVIETTQAATEATTQPTEPTEEMVWIPTHGGTKYHSRSSCSNMDNPSHVPISQAIARGFTPCKRCY